MKTTAKRVLAIAAALTLSACSSTQSKFSCPVPGGVKCMSATDVYEATNFSDRVMPRNTTAQMSERTERREVRHEVQDEVSAAVVDGPVQPVAYRPYQYAQATPNGNSLAVQAPQVMSTAAVTSSGMVRSASMTTEPHRDAAKVLEVWVGAFEDEAGRLHMPTNVYVEIEPRKWSIGHQAQVTNRGFSLLEIPDQGAAQDGQGRADAGARPR